MHRPHDQGANRTAFTLWNALPPQSWPPKPPPPESSRKRRRSAATCRSRHSTWTLPVRGVAMPSCQTRRRSRGGSPPAPGQASGAAPPRTWLPPTCLRASTTDRGQYAQENDNRREKEATRAIERRTHIDSPPLVSRAVRTADGCRQAGCHHELLSGTPTDKERHTEDASWQHGNVRPKGEGTQRMPRPALPPRPPRAPPRARA